MMTALIVLGSIAFELVMASLTTRILILRWIRLDGPHITDDGFDGDRPFAIFGAILLGLFWPITLPYILAMESVNKTLDKEETSEAQEAMQVSEELKEWTRIYRNAADSTEKEIAEAMINKLKPSSK